MLTENAGHAQKIKLYYKKVSNNGNKNSDDA
jgi:hypothetical protein